MDYPTRLESILKDSNEVLKDFNIETSSTQLEELLLKVQKCNETNKVMNETLLKLENMEVSIFDKAKHNVILNSYRNITQIIGEVNEIVSKDPIKFSSDEVKELIYKIRF